MSSTKPTEPITSEPVIVPSPNTKDSTSKELEPETIDARLQRLENLVLPPKLVESRTPSRSPSITRHRRSRSRELPIRRERERYNSPLREDLVTFTNSTSLEDFLSKTSSSPDALVEIQSGLGRCNTYMIHLTTVPTHQAELDKHSWIVTAGLEDCWVQKSGGRETLRFDNPGAAARGGRGRVEIFEDRYGNQFEDRFERSGIPLVKLGETFTTIFKDGGDEGVKFLTVIQGKGTSGWLKLITSYSKKNALVDLFHEILNGFSILFVGAVLADVDLSNIWKLEGSKDEYIFKKVGTVDEARALEGHVIGVIC